MNTKFNSRETYLAYRSEWKARYNELSETIREKKWMRNEYNRACNQAYTETKGKWPDFHKRTIELLNQNARYAQLQEKYKGERKWLELYRKEATAMLEELKEAKVEAQRQYLASKEKEMVLA